MKKHESIHLDFVVDKLTNSIQNTIFGDSFITEVLRFTKADLKQVVKKNGWNFNWKGELSDNTKEVFKLTILNNSDIVQGLLSLTLESDHVYMHLLENAPFNIGERKLYEGVAGNLVAHACKLSFQQGFEGFVAFTAKTKLIEHYQKSLGAYCLSPLNIWTDFSIQFRTLNLGRYEQYKTQMEHRTEAPDHSGGRSIRPDRDITQARCGAITFSSLEA